MSREDEKSNMQQRRITLPDGRYLIFYTFEDEATAPVSSDGEAGARRPEPESLPETEAERRAR
jgi:hypothetical protein